MTEQKIEATNKDNKRPTAWARKETTMENNKHTGRRKPTDTRKGDNMGNKEIYATSSKKQKRDTGAEASKRWRRCRK